MFWVSASSFVASKTITHIIKFAVVRTQSKLTWHFYIIHRYIVYFFFFPRINQGYVVWYCTAYILINNCPIMNQHLLLPDRVSYNDLFFFLLLMLLLCVHMSIIVYVLLHICNVNVNDLSDRHVISGEGFGFGEKWAGARRWWRWRWGRGPKSSFDIIDDSYLLFCMCTLLIGYFDLKD